MATTPVQPAEVRRLPILLYMAALMLLVGFGSPAYALILPVLMLVPKPLIATHDGEFLPIDPDAADLEALAVQRA